MDGQQNPVRHLTQQSTQQRPLSLREQSVSTIREAIHSPSDDGETLRRANVCLALFYDPDTDMETRRDMRSAFVKALHHVPAWAMHKAFDDWERTMQRRPSPGEIVILAERALKPLTAEIKQRTPQPEEPPRVTPSPEEASQILARAGFTPARIAAVQAAPMATSFAEAEEKHSQPRKKHWAGTADPDGPEWEALRRSRAANALMFPPKKESQNDH